MLSTIQRTRNDAARASLLRRLGHERSAKIARALDGWGCTHPDGRCEGQLRYGAHSNHALFASLICSDCGADVRELPEQTLAARNQQQAPRRVAA